ncbi:MAG: hypothetical protein LBI54_03215 [Lachnospiraceae bacterium]|jgi:hypothetical protein|nr:hypothetical protein [Lachnospiraceae bacterium]
MNTYDFASYNITTLGLGGIIYNMNTYVFLTFVIFFVWFTYEIRKSSKKGHESNKSFWEREREADNVRKQPLDDLAYIEIPFDSLPLQVLAEDERIAEYHETLRSLAERPIVNLSCISNTDLKLKYGAPNINILSRYDSAYTVLARTLQHWAEKLHKAGFTAEARDILEFAVETGTDIKGTYVLLAEIYIEEGAPEKIAGLIAEAEGHNSSLSKGIVKKLKEMAEAGAP